MHKKKFGQKISSFCFLFKPFWKFGKLYVILSLVMPVVCNVVSIFVSTSLNRDIIDAIVAGVSFNNIVLTALFYESILAIAIIADSFVSLHIQNKNYHRIASRIKKMIYNKALCTDIKNTDSPKFYDSYTWTINEYVKQSDMAVSLLSKILVSVASIATVFAVISSLSWYVVLIIGIYTLLMIPVDQNLNRLTVCKKEEINTNNRRLEYIQRLIYQKEYLFTLHITDFKKFLFKDFDKTYEEIIVTQDKYNNKIFVMTSLQSLATNLVTLLIMTIYIWLISIGSMSIGSFVSVMAAVTILRKTFYSFANHYKTLGELSLSTEKMFEFFNTPSTIEASTSVRALNKISSIIFENVSFSYPNSKQGIKNINFEIKQGMKIAIVGNNGSGKSTLVKLLLRLYDPQRGAIKLNNYPLVDYNLKEYRDAIGVALQDSQVFSFSIKENISRYGDVDDSTIESVLKQLKLYNIIKISNGDYEHQLLREFDKNGIELSGGERQKLAIASVLVKNFELLVFDEPTASLDPISEFELNQLILSEANNNTTILISHRLSSVKKADIIIVMNEGEIIEQGTHKELIDLKGVYYEMYEKQSKEYIE